ncbi:hypothetical protein GYH30_015298 [Glycine max]|nr:hypothetical protein GYH30_015298 [Glycine max]
MAMHLQATTISLNTARSPPPSLAPATNAGLRPHFNPLALKSSFFSGSLNLLLHPNQQLTSGAARISMRVASKQAYICRDCGGVLQFVVLQKEGLGPTLQLLQETQMIKMLERHENPKSRKKKQSGTHFLLQLPWELQCLWDYTSI